MIKQMLVPVKENRLRQIVPHLAKIVTPECQIVFLLRYLGEKHECSLSHVSHIYGFLRFNNFGLGENGLPYAWNTSLAVANKGLRAEERSCDPGVQVAVDLFSGSLKSALKRHITDSQFQLVILPCKPLRRWINSSSRNIPNLNFFLGDPLLVTLLLEPKDLNDRSLSIFLSQESNWC